MTRLTLLLVFICGFIYIDSVGQTIAVHTPEIVEEELFPNSPNIRQFSVTGLPEPDVMPCNCPVDWSVAGYSYFWKFGDGAYSTRANPVHEYDYPGDFDVRVQVTPIYTEDEDIDQIKDSDDGDNPEGDTDPSDNDQVVELKLDDPIVVPADITFHNRFRDNSTPFFGNQTRVFYNRDARANNPMTLVSTISEDGLYNVTFDSQKLELEHFDLFTLAPSEVVDISDNLSVSGNTCDKEILLERMTNNTDFTQDHFRLHISNPSGTDCAFDTENIFVNFRVSGLLEPGDLVTTEDAMAYMEGAPTSIDLSFRVASSFDPNEKSVDKETITNTSEHLTYTIDFQNYGDGAASNIKITERIPEHLEISSIQVQEVFVGADGAVERDLNISSSPGLPSSDNGNGYFEYIINPDGESVDFNMNNVHLVGLGPNPDDFCGVLSTKGQLVYTINTKPSAFDLSTTFGTSADIYFDGNEPVTTNIASTQYIDPLPVYPINNDCATYTIDVTTNCPEETYNVYLNVLEDGIYDVSINGGGTETLFVDNCLGGSFYSIFAMYGSDVSVEITNVDTGCTITEIVECPSSFPCNSDEAYAYGGGGSSLTGTQISNSISAGKRDVLEHNGSIQTGGALVCLNSGNEKNIGFKFTGFGNIPEGAIVTDAYIELNSSLPFGVVNPHGLVFEIEDRVNPKEFVTTSYNFVSSANTFAMGSFSASITEEPLVFVSNNNRVTESPEPIAFSPSGTGSVTTYHNLENRTMAPYYKIWTAPSSIGANATVTIDGLEDLVQFVINKEGWDESNGSMVFKASRLLDGNDNSIAFHSYNTNSSLAPKLVVEYLVVGSISCKNGEEEILTKEIELSAYPNPATDFIQLEFDAAPTNGQVELFNLQGQRVLVEPISQGTTAHYLELNGLVSGIYLAKLTVGTESKVQKIIIE